MHFVDTTMFLCPRGGGVKQYLLAKRSWLTQLATPVRHTLLVPGPLAGVDGIEQCGGSSIPLLDGYRFPLSVRRWRNALCELKPDLIEAGDPYVPGLAAREAGQRLGIPAVAFFHSDVPRMLSQRVGSWIGPAARAYLRGLYWGFDLVLAPSYAMLEKLHAWGVENAAVQPLGVDVQVFDPALKDPALRHEIGVTPDTRLLVYAGRFACEKNLHVLRGAVEKLGEPYHLLLVGADRFARVGKQLTHWPYERNARQLARVLASCDALVHAGDQETFGLIAIEAMACGLPVVAVGFGGIKELIDNSVGVVAERPGINLMAGAIGALFDRDVRQLGVEARARAVRRHSWNAAFSRLGQHYASLAGQHIGQWELRVQPEH